jgi:molybdopterin-guanine dinucleotide biosynthesis protein A
MDQAIYPDITGVLLVGGKSRRMGQDKAFLTIEGKPFVERIIEVFRHSFDRILLVGDREERFARYGLPVEPDIFPGSPLGGIYTGLQKSVTDYIFVSSCDLPFPNGEVLRHICSLRNGFDAVVPVTPHGYEPLFALYAQSCLGPIKGLLESGNFCAHAFYPQVRVRNVTSEELAHLDSDGKAFLNINTPEQFAGIGGAP